MEEGRLAEEHHESQVHLAGKGETTSLSCTAQQPNICTMISLCILLDMDIVIIALAPTWAVIFQISI